MMKNNISVKENQTGGAINSGKDVKGKLVSANKLLRLITLFS